MAKDKDKETSIFDIGRLRELIELMQEHELNEVDLKQAEQRIRLRRGPDGAPVAYTSAPAPVAAPAAAPVAAAAGGDAAPAADDNSIYIVSEAVGTFYSKPKPDKPSFVSVGDKVNEDTIVCLIEAMKLFNEVPAGVSGTIKEVLVKEGDPVDHGMKLFRVEP